MSKRTVFGVGILFLALLIAALQWFAHTYYLYYLWWWADIVIHFLGGVFIALGTLWFIRYEVPISIRSKVPYFLSAFIVIIAVGVGWEIFEWIFDAHASVNYTLDTTLDLLMDIAGMLAAYLLFSRYGK